MRKGWLQVLIICFRTAPSMLSYLTVLIYRGILYTRLGFIHIHRFISEKSVLGILNHNGNTVLEKELQFIRGNTVDSRDLYASKALLLIP